MFAFFLTFVAVGQALIGVAANTDAITVINVGSSLHASGGQTSWLSPSGRFAFGFYPDGQGFSVGINMFVSLDKSLVIWTAAGDQGINPSSKDAVLSFTEQGFLLTASNGAKAITLIEFNATKSTVAYMLDSGNFIVNDSSHSSNTAMDCSPTSAQMRSDPYLIWQSFDNPTDTMMGGQVLPCGTNLISRHSTTDHLFYQLSMQCDSNLVIYAIKKTITADGNTTQDSSYPIWASLTYKEGYDKLILSEGGHLFLSNLNGTTYPLSPYGLKDSHEKMIYYAKQTPNKYFWLFALNLVTNKSTYLYEIPTLIDDCQRNSSCGMNSYCVPVTNGVHCQCLPSFNYTDSRAKAKGCQRSIAEPNCWPPGSSDTTAFSMEPVENLLWYDEAYSIVSADSKEDCSSICLSECDCEAAVFFNQRCSKYKLPMSRASIGNNISTGMRTTFIKTSAEGIGRNTEVDQSLKRHLMAVLLCGAIDAGVLLALLAAGAGSYWLFYGKYRLLWRKWELAFQEEVAPRSFSFEELSKATNSFAPEKELGRGGHATVYKGDLTMYGKPNPVPVAVKRFNKEEGKGDTDFQAEIRIIGRAQHVNLVRLLGFCYEGSNRLLIYEYMNRGSLADLIDKPLCPSWRQRVEILLGVARGLNYLHRECETKIIHRDIKPENILIAEKPENWVVKISDFGISKLSVEGHPATKRTSAPGTPGYVAPECVRSKGEDLTEKADVYSFGIVVLETVFWKRNTLDKLLQSASEYFEDLNKKKLENVKLAEAELDKERMMQLAMLCVKENRGDRPYMEDVILRMLEWVAPASSVTAAVSPQTITVGKKVSWAPLVK